MSRNKNLAEKTEDLEKDLAKQNKETDDLKKDLTKQTGDLKEDLAKETGDLKEDLAKQNKETGDLKEKFGADINQVQQEVGEIDVRLSKSEKRTAVCGYRYRLGVSSTTTLTFFYDEV